MEVHEKEALVRYLEERQEVFIRMAQSVDMDEVELTETKGYLVGLSHGFGQSAIAVITSGALTPTGPEGTGKEGIEKAGE